MKNFKVLKAAFIMFILLFAVTGVIFADENTSKFTDIDDSWAKQYIINVYNKGLMGGFSETEFKPDSNVKNYDALVSISRMIKQEKDINLELLEEKYQESILDKFNIPEYARDGILICLDEGLIGQYDIIAFDDAPYAKRQDIAKYLGAAFGVKYNDNDPPAALPFLDTLDIPTMYRPHVKFLIDNGIVNESGDAEGKFNPKAYIDRAGFAKMLDISSDVYAKKLSGQDTETTGSDSEIIWTDDSGSIDSSETDSGTAVTADEDVQADVSAYVDQVIPEYGNLAVFVGTERRVYRIAENAECIIDDVSSGFWKLEKSDMVKLYIEGEKVTKIIAESKIRKITGKLVDIQSSDETVLTMETQNGETRNYTITAKTVVIKDGKNALWQELKAGNDLVVTTSYNELIEINADGIKSTDKGVIESLVYSRIAPPKIVITALDESQNTYYAEEDMEITGADGDVYSLRPGMQVEVNLIDDEITKIAVINETTLVPTELKGVIKSIDLEAGLIAVEVYDSSTNKYVDKKIYITSETKIADIDFNFLGLGSLKVNQIISIRGTGTADGISAKTIQVVN